MRLIDTLTNQSKFNMITGTPVGIFPTMILSDDLYYSYISDLCLGYYTARSGMKPLSATYILVQELIDDYGTGYGLFIPNGSDSFSTSNNEIFKVLTSEPIGSPEDVIGKLIRGKFKHKWDKIYKALIEEEYNILNNREYTTEKTGNNTDITTKTGSSTGTNKKIGDSSDTTTYNTTLIDDGTTGIKITTTTDGSIDNSIFGFNSDTAVNANTRTDKDSETVTGSEDDNTTHNTRKNIGTDTKDFTINETVTLNNNNNETINNTGNNLETIKISGRNNDAPDMIMKELNLRNKQLFFDIIYSDIDSITALQIYI